MGLQIHDNHRFQRTEWRVERVGWALLTLFLLAGLVGLLGTGPVSWGSVTSENRVIRLEYQRVTHLESDDSLTFALSPSAVEDGTATVHLTGEWLSSVDVTGIAPEPAEQVALPDGVALQFAVAEAPTTVAVTYRAQNFGSLSGSLAADGDRLSFTQLVLP